MFIYCEQIINMNACWVINHVIASNPLIRKLMSRPDRMATAFMLAVYL
jgi:hypothetical protein